MKTDARAPQAPESYATFWEPVAEPTPPATPTGTTSSDSSAKDAYLEFVNVTEGVHGAPSSTRN